MSKKNNVNAINSKVIRVIVSIIAIYSAILVNAQTIPVYIPTDSLIAWYPFNGNANDESGNGNNGTNNGAILTTDRFGNANKAYSFNGTNSYINCPSGTSTSLNVIGNITYCFWLKTSQTSKEGCITSFGNQQSYTGGYLAGLNDGTASYIPRGKLGYFISTWDTSTISLNNNSWRFIVISLSNDTMRLYIDGILDRQSTGVTPTSSWSGNRTIGKTNYALDGFFQGDLDDIAIWNRALSSDEIEDIYNAISINCDVDIVQNDTTICQGESVELLTSIDLGGTNCYVQSDSLSDSLVGYWPFCGNAIDESGNGNDGIVNGATLTADRFGNPNSAYSFDRANGNNISFTRNSLGNDSSSVSGWIYTSSPAGGPIFHIGANDYSFTPCNGYFLALGSASLVPPSSWIGDTLIQSASCVYSNNTGFNINLNTWYHFTLVREINIMKIYINGNLINTYNASSIKTPDNKMFFGSTYLTNCAYFNGKIDDIGMWNRALSQVEIQQLFNKGTESYLWSTGDTTQTITVTPDTTTTYWFTVSNGFTSCYDSITITVKPIRYGNITSIVCDSFVSPTGKVYTDAGIYSDTIVSSLGCDSVISIILSSDTIKPSVLTQDKIIYLDAAGSVTVADIDNGSTDNCTIATRTLSKSSFDCSEVGANTIYLVVTDVNGNIDSASAVVTVQDIIKPTVVTQNVTVSLDASGAGSVTVSDIDNGSTDNCTIATRTLSKTNFDCNNVGANTIYLIVTDVNSNIDSASAVVTVQDIIKPTVLTQNVTVSLDASGAGSVTVADIDNGSTDNCSIASRTLSKSSFDCSHVGANTIYLIVTDVNGNIDSASAVVTVQDTIKPTVLTQNVTVSLDASGAGSVTVADIDNGSIDNCSIASRTLSKTSFDCSNVGANTIYLIVTDVNGNIDSASAVVTVQDTIKPTVLTQNVTVSLDASGAGSVTVADIDNGSTDNCTIATRTLSKTSFDCSNVGANTIYLIVTDVNGNIDSASAVVTVQDTIKPTVVTTPSDIALGYCDATYTYAIPTGDDNCGVTVTQIAGLPPGSTFPVGLTVNTFEISDPSGNTVTTSFTVDIRARYMPFAISDTSICNNNNKIDLSKGFDNIIFIGSGVEANEKFFNPNSLEPGSYSITAEFTDSMGCVSTDTFEVTIRIMPIVPVIERVASDQIVTEDIYGSYQWYRNGEKLNGENRYHLRVRELGLYTVLVGNAENCFEASEGYGFGIPVNEENVTNQGLVKVFPNPTRDMVFVQINDEVEFHLLTLADAVGNKLIEQETSTKVVKLDLTSLAPGTYYLNVAGTLINETVVIVKN